MSRRFDFLVQTRPVLNFLENIAQLMHGQRDWDWNFIVHVLKNKLMFQRGIFEGSPVPPSLSPHFVDGMLAQVIVMSNHRMLVELKITLRWVLRDLVRLIDAAHLESSLSNAWGPMQLFQRQLMVFLEVASYLHPLKMHVQKEVTEFITTILGMQLLRSYRVKVKSWLMLHSASAVMADSVLDTLLDLEFCRVTCLKVIEIEYFTSNTLRVVRQYPFDENMMLRGRILKRIVPSIENNAAYEKHVALYKEIQTVEKLKPRKEVAKKA